MESILAKQGLQACETCLTQARLAYLRRRYGTKVNTKKHEEIVIYEVNQRFPYVIKIIKRRKIMITNLMIMAADAGATQQGGGMGLGFIVAYIAVFAVLIYFMFVRPQKKQTQQQEDMMKSLKPGDSIMTTSGFYGTVIGIDDDTVIVEFGNNKNCRIPMHKKAIADIESADAEEEDVQEEETETNTKLGKKKK